jgi:hypothetical protein
MGSQNASRFFAVFALAFGCGRGNAENPTLSSLSLPEDAPDLSLQGVAFARLSEGRVVARGTAERVDYRRAGGRFAATGAGALIYPEPGSGLAALGTLHVVAPRLEGDVPARRGTASDVVRLEADRGDSAITQRVHLDGDVLQTDTQVRARGPGYQVQGNGLLARTDGTVIRLISGVNGQLQMEGPR